MIFEYILWAWDMNYTRNDWEIFSLSFLFFPESQDKNWLITEYSWIK